MRIFNGVLLTLLDIVALVCCGAIILVSTGLLRPEVFDGAPWFEDRLTPFMQLTGTDKAETLFVCGGLLLLGLVLLAFEVGTAMPRRRLAATTRDGLGSVTMDDDVIRELANREAAQVPGVQALRLRVKQSRTGLRLQGQLSVEPLGNLAELAHEVQLRIRTSLERALGQRVEQIHLQCIPLRGRPPVGAAMDRQPPAEATPSAEVRPEAPASGERVASRNGVGVH